MGYIGIYRGLKGINGIAFRYFGLSHNGSLQGTLEELKVFDVGQFHAISLACRSRSIGENDND